MNLEHINPKWRDAIQSIATEFSIPYPENFEEGILQSPADLLVWTPEEMPEEVEQKLEWACQKTGRFMFLSLPYEDGIQLVKWKNIIESHLGIREWLAFDHQEKRLICTARRTTEWQMGTVVGAMNYELRREQILHNIKVHKKRVIVPRIEHQTPLIMVCYGPSIHETWRTAVAEAKTLGGHIATNSGAHDFMIAKGVVPTYHVEIDPRPERAEFSETPNDAVKYLIASVCSPKLTDKLAPFNMELFHLNDGDESREIFDYEPEATLTDGGACVSLRSLSLFYQMGYRYFSIYGFDCSFKNDMQWAGKHPGKFHKTQEARIEGIDRTFRTSSALLTYASQFFEHVNMLPDARFYLHGDGLLQSWAIANAKKAQLAASAAE